MPFFLLWLSACFRLSFLVGLSQTINQESRDNGEEEERNRGKQDDLFSSLQFVLLNFGPNLLCEAIVLVTYLQACQQWTIEKAGVGEGAGLCLSEASQAELKVKAGSSMGGSCERAVKGSCAREGV